MSYEDLMFLRHRLVQTGKIKNDPSIIKQKTILEHNPDVGLRQVDLIVGVQNAQVIKATQEAGKQAPISQKSEISEEKPFTQTSALPDMQVSHPTLDQSSAINEQESPEAKKSIKKRRKKLIFADEDDDGQPVAGEPVVLQEHEPNKDDAKGDPAEPEENDEDDAKVGAALFSEVSKLREAYEKASDAVILAGLTWSTIEDSANEETRNSALGKKYFDTVPGTPIGSLRLYANDDFKKLDLQKQMEIMTQLEIIHKNMFLDYANKALAKKKSGIPAAPAAPAAASSAASSAAPSAAK